MPALLTVLSPAVTALAVFDVALFASTAAATTMTLSTLAMLQKVALPAFLTPSPAVAPFAETNMAPLALSPLQTPEPTSLCRIKHNH